MNELIPLNSNLVHEENLDLENQMSVGYGTFRREVVSNYVAQNGLFSLPYGILQSILQGDGFEMEEEEEEIPVDALRIINNLFCMMILIFSICAFVTLLGFIFLHSDLPFS